MAKHKRHKNAGGGTAASTSSHNCEERPVAKSFVTRAIGEQSVFMDIDEIAELFGTTPDAIHRSRANGNFFPAVRIAGRLLWRRDLIELGLAEQLERDEAALAERRRARLAKRRGSTAGVVGA